MVAKPTWDKYNEECVLPKKPASLEECETLFLMLFAQVGRNINPYAIDYPVCTEDSVVSTLSTGSDQCVVYVWGVCVLCKDVVMCMYMYLYVYAWHALSHLPAVLLSYSS